MAEAEFVDLNLYVAERVSGARSGPPAAASRASAALRLFRLYENADRSLFGSNDDVLAASEVPAGAGPPIRLAVAKQDSSADRTLLAAESLAALRQASLDVIVLLAPARLEGQLRGLAREGVWVVRFGDPRRSAGGPQLFWQLYEGGGAIEVSLVALGEEPPVRVIYRSCARSHPVSLHRTRVNAHSTAARFPLRCLRELRHSGLDGLEARAHWRAASVEDPIVERELPSVATLARHLARVTAKGMGRVLRKRFLREDWHVGFRAHGGTLAESLEDLQIVPAQRNHFLADPFLVERGDRHWLFFEDYSYEERKAVISTAGIGAGAEPGRTRLALAREHHLSYPCVFEWEGDYFMIPESSRTARVNLYRANAFPDQWRLEKVLMEGLAAGDPTVLRHGGTLWLFVAVDPYELGSVKSELWLFSADSPQGPWIPHPLNPVVTDVRRARPAGMIFRKGDDLIRPGQDNSRRYGGGVTLSRIEALSADEYREVPVGWIGPERLAGVRSLHTYNADTVYETIDFQRSVPRLPRMAHRARAPRPAGRGSALQLFMTS